MGHVSRWPWSLREMSADAEVALLRGGRTEEREDGTLCPRPQLSAFPQPRLQRPKDLRLWAVPAHRRLSAAGRQLAGERETDRERDRETDRERAGQREGQRDREKETERQTVKDKGAWFAEVHGVAKSQTKLRD